MSLKTARKLLTRIKWKHFMGHKIPIRRRGYAFKAFMGRQYGRSAIWVTSNNKIVYMHFFEADHWHGVVSMGTWIDKDTFTLQTGFDSNSYVLSETMAGEDYEGVTYDDSSRSLSDGGCDAVPSNPEPIKYWRKLHNGQPIDGEAVSSSSVNDNLVDPDP